MRRGAPSAWVLCRERIAAGPDSRPRAGERIAEIFEWLFFKKEGAGFGREQSSWRKKARLTWQKSLEGGRKGNLSCAVLERRRPQMAGRS